MSRNLARPFFPLPPAEYDQRYMSSVIEAFAIFLQQAQNPGEGRNTRLVLTGLPQNDSGLEIGALFQLDGFVRIATLNLPHVAGLSATASVGSVTVTT